MTQKTKDQPVNYGLVKVINLVGLFILITLSISSCNERSIELTDSFKINYSYQIDTLKLPIDSHTSVNNSHYGYFDLGKESDEYFVIFNQLINSIQFYNFKTLNKAFQIDLTEEGPNAITQVSDPNSSFYVHNLDSIYFLSSNLKKLYLLNHKGNKINEYNLSLNGGILWPRSKVDAAPLQLLDDYLVFSTSYTREIINSNKADYNDRVYLHGFNIKNEEIKSFDLGLPSQYPWGTWQRNDYEASVLVIPEKEDIIIGYPMSHDIFSLKNGSLTPHNAQGSMAKIDKPSKKEKTFAATGDYDAMIQYKMTNAAYFKTVYSKKADLFFRLVRNPITVEEYKNDPPYDFDLSVIILDGKKKRIGQIEIDRSVHFFTTKDGSLIISPGSLNNDEDNLYFYKFKFEKNEAT